MSKYLLTLFLFFMPFFFLFLLELSCLLPFFFLFSFLFTPFFFFFFSFGVAQFFFFSFWWWTFLLFLSCFRCGTFLLFLSGGVPNLFLFLVSFPGFLYSGGLVYSLSPLIAWTSRSEIDSSLFLAASLIVSSRTIMTSEWHLQQPARPP